MNDVAATSSRASDRLTPGLVYTRADLRARFAITDNTLENGVFVPKGLGAIWLFVTRDKESSTTQYVDRLKGDLLHWQGQAKGRTDRIIIGHEASDLDLLVFYREKKRQYDDYGFRYEGPFRYLSHELGPPTNFVLQRIVRSPDIDDTTPVPDSDPSNIEDGRAIILAEVRRRQGQAAFRKALIEAY